MRKLIPFLKWFLLIWGGLSLVGAIGIGGFFAYQLGPGNIDNNDSASKKDVRFVLNWCELGDEVSGVLDDAVDFLAGWLNSGEIPWFPSEEELRSDRYFVYPRSIYCHGVRPTAAQLIFVRPSDKMIFYFSGKT